MDLLELIRKRQSSRVAFDPDRRIPEEHLRQILEGARWAPTAHNMQNFEIVVIDDPKVLARIAQVRSDVSRVFVEENYEQLSFSEEELRRKKVGLLGSSFPKAWRTPGVKPLLDEEHAHSILGRPIAESAALLVVLYDARKRAPASEGDVLGKMSLGCVMENMWLVATACGIGFQIQSVFGNESVERQVNAILGVPDHLRIGFAVRLGYPKESAAYVRVRREVEDFTHRNEYRRR